MKVQIWNSFSCNNSSDYRLVARFKDPVLAAKAGARLAAFFEAYAEEFDRHCEDEGGPPEDEPLPSAAALAREHGVAWSADDILSWGDEGLQDNVPDIAVEGTTLAIFHDYCGGFTDNVVRVLAAAGAEVEPEDSCPPEISLRFVLPAGERGERMADELAKFLNQKSVHEYMSDFAKPPWGDHRLMGDPADIYWYREGDRFAFKMPLSPVGLPDLKKYLADVTELDLRLCDELELASFEMRDTLAELDARLAAAGTVTELELGERKLRFVPPRVLELTGLRKLVLSDNPLRELPAGLAALRDLEELEIAGCELTALPDELASLSKLRVLDISKNPLAAIPPVIAKLPALRELGANMMTGCDLSALAGASGLEVLALQFLKPAAKGLLAFPREILALRKLRSLDVSTSALSGIPDAIVELRELETLNLDGVLGHNTQLPPLHELPKLTKLLAAGGASNTGKYAPHSVLDGIWKITTLRHLGIDRYGEQKNERGPLTKLPDDAFARMPHLAVLDISFNELTTLPASFFALAELESVDLRYTKLDRATLDKLRATFPRVKLDLRSVQTRHDVDDPHWQAVHAKVKAGAGKLRSDRAAAVAELEAALAMCTPGSVYSDYDELYAEYGCVDALGHLRLAAQGAEREAIGDRQIAHATRALELVPQPGTIWHFTDEGAFQEEVTRRAGNALAWMCMERGQLDRALSVVERALSVGGDRGYIFDTKVRILLKAGREREAYAIVDSILAEDPEFKDFQDLKSSPAYLDWLAKGRPGA
ncbi:MAG TPA: leucine-rich repeat domain-containing protein [Kofleriaceae bacterium]|nr:leucine-rich repeat domain-containing protein [Kofleriaceae bacterium]